MNNTSIYELITRASITTGLKIYLFILFNFILSMYELFAVLLISGYVKVMKLVGILKQNGGQVD